MKPLSESDLQEFRTAVEKDYGIKLEGKDLYQAAFNLLKFFESLIGFDREDKKKKETGVRKSS